MVSTAPTIAQESVLDVRRVAKSFGRHQVLRDVSFRMGQGEIVGIVGENGAGKSTLLQILLGLSAPHAGDVAVRGRVGYCPQDLMIFETLTVRENFRYFAAAYGLLQPKRTAPWEARMAALLRRFRFQQYEHTLAANLSGGTKQKLNLSLALLHAPDVLILDEPYTGFDWETYLHFWGLAEELRDRGNSLLIVSHFVYDRSKFDRLFELTEGVLRCVGAT